MGKPEVPVSQRGHAAMLRRAYRRVLDGADHPSGPAILVLLAIIEATVFPAPTEALLLALALGRPRWSWVFGALAAVASAAGGLAGYWIGAELFERFGQPLLSSLGLLRHLDTIGVVYRDNALLALATSGYTPIPYLMYTIAAGAFGIPLPLFVAGALAGRALKYLPLVLLVSVFGPRIRPLLDRHAPWVAAAAVALVLLWFIVVL